MSIQVKRVDCSSNSASVKTVCEGIHASARRIISLLVSLNPRLNSSKICSPTFRSKINIDGRVVGVLAF